MAKFAKRNEERLEGSLNFRISREMWDGILQAAKRLNISTDEFVRHAIRQSISGLAPLQKTPVSKPKKLSSSKRKRTSKIRSKQAPRKIVPMTPIQKIVEGKEKVDLEKFYVKGYSQTNAPKEYARKADEPLGTRKDFKKDSASWKGPKS